MRTFSHGLHYADLDAPGVTESRFDAVPLTAMPPPAPSDLVPLPPASTWVNLRTLGAKGDGVTDDTAVFKKAIAEHRAIYVPSGYYVISDTLTLKPDTVLIGVHPLATQIDLLDRTGAFQGVGTPKPMIEAPKGGTNVVIGIGLYTNGINPRALAAKWMAGANSMMNDVRLLGGHGTNNLDGTRANPYNNNRTADPDANRRWDSQYPSLWVTDGGGGTFLGLWTPSSFAQAGLLVSDTTTEGRVYGMSSEHHVRYEVQLHRVANWKLYSLQTEEERGESGFALPLEIVDSHDITVANFHLYRVISSYQPFPWAVTVANSRNIHFRNFHCYSNSKVSFDAAVSDRTRGVELRQREFAWLTVQGPSAASTSAAKPPSPLLESGAAVQKLATGFFNISGGAAELVWRLLLRGRALATHSSLVRAATRGCRRCGTRRSSPSTSRSTRRTTCWWCRTRERERSTRSHPGRRSISCNSSLRWRPRHALAWWLYVRSATGASGGTRRRDVRRHGRLTTCRPTGRRSFRRERTSSAARHRGASRAPTWCAPSG